MDKYNQKEISTGEFAELTSFRRDILIVLAGLDDSKGLRIKNELESYYDGNINHGRLYPNLDALAEQGYIEKFAVDRRSNGYRLTMKAKKQLLLRLNWQSAHIDDNSIVEKQLSDQSAVKTDTETIDKPSQGDTGRSDAGTNKTPVGKEVSDQLETLSDELLDELE